MSKEFWVLLISVLTFLPVAQAKTAEHHALSTLSFETHIGGTGSRTLQIDNEQVRINQKSLEPAAVIQYQRRITKMLSLERPNPIQQPCRLGRFVHRVKIDGSLKEERGCIEDERFKQLFAVFDKSA